MGNCNSRVHLQSLPQRAVWCNTTLPYEDFFDVVEKYARNNPVRISTLLLFSGGTLYLQCVLYLINNRKIHILKSLVAEIILAHHSYHHL